MTRVRTGGATPSRIVLPAVPERGSAAMPSLPPSTMPVSTMSRTPQRAWAVVDDLLGNSTRVRCSFRSYGGTRPFEFVARVNRAVPAEPSITGKFQIEKKAGGRSVSATASTVISSTMTAYHVTVALTVRVDDDAVLTRQWADSLKRQA